MKDSFVDALLREAEILGGETFFPSQPCQTYAAWGDEISADGSDFDNEIRRHQITVELYELMDAPDPAAHARLQETLDRHALPWHKEPRMVELSLRLYFTQYNFEYVTRR